MATQWLDAEERRAWLRFVMVLELMPGVLDTQLRRDADLSHFDYFVLAGLSEAPGRTVRMTELAALSHASVPRLSHVVSRLEERGYVVRRACDSDRRAIKVVLTDAGWDKVVATAPGHVAHVRHQIVDALSREQLDQLAGICDALLDRIPHAAQMLEARGLPR